MMYFRVGPYATAHPDRLATGPLALSGRSHESMKIWTEKQPIPSCALKL